ncbi:lysozyme inhibitor LprI family protein [Brucella sp. BE17]|uniref:lysozyme inhibitor LprI family protein n=1 Tax=Brucella sp. BE17 TaxID=3142977 RepID=UPI0031B9D967
MHKIRYILATALLTTCLANTAFADELPVEKGDALSQCYAEIGVKPRTELESCLNNHAEEAKNALKAKFTAVKKEIEDTGSSASEAAVKSLEASQEAFEAFKRAECQRVSDAAMGGSGAGDFARGCDIDLMRWRTNQLGE